MDDSWLAAAFGNLVDSIWPEELHGQQVRGKTTPETAADGLRRQEWESARYKFSYVIKIDRANKRCELVSKSLVKK